MTLPRLSKLELKILNILWEEGDLAIREVQEAFPKRKRPAYTTIQTTIYRLETKGAVERGEKDRQRAHLQGHRFQKGGSAPAR